MCGLLSSNWVSCSASTAAIFRWKSSSKSSIPGHLLIPRIYYFSQKYSVSVHARCLTAESIVLLRYDHYQRDYMLNEAQYFSRYYSIFQLCSLSYYLYQCIRIFKRTKDQAHLRGFFCLFWVFFGCWWWKL